MQREFDSLVENNFEWQKAPRNKNIVSSMVSIRLLLQIAVQYDLLIHHMDVMSTYLNAPLDYEIYVEPPEGFECKNGNYVWKLKKKP